MIVTNDGATILAQIEIKHPAAKILVELAQTQDESVGDGTTSVVILAAELMKVRFHPCTMITMMMIMFCVLFCIILYFVDVIDFHICV